MKTIRILTIILLIACLFTITGGTVWAGPQAEQSHGNTGKQAETSPDAKEEGNAGPDKIGTEARVMHPPFKLLDKDGLTVTDESANISAPRTCGQCHDTGYINSHNVHYTERVRTDCVVCHFEGGKIVGTVDTHSQIGRPTNDNCAACHGIIHTDSRPLSIPGDYETMDDFKNTADYNWKLYDFTRTKGVILSARDISDSYLNLKNKAALHFPWDIHTRRKLDCISCHFTANDPAHSGVVDMSLPHLIRDPRKIQSPGQYLKHPDHRLATAACTHCHDPYKGHKGFPYKTRHMHTLSCQACHVPEIYGPALRTVDNTVLTAEGKPRMEYRGIAEGKSSAASINTEFLKGYLPFLFPHKNLGENAEEHPLKISPFNLVTQWVWKSKKTGGNVPIATLRAVYLNGPRYADDVTAEFDANGNKMIDDEELILDSAKKIDFIKKKLTAAGIAEPILVGRVDAYKINHGVLDVKHMIRDCHACHNENSKFGSDVLLAARGPKGIVPEFSKDALPVVNGEILHRVEGGMVLKRSSNVPGHYLLGHGRSEVLDTVGLMLLLLTILFVLGHGGMRLLAARKTPPHKGATKIVYMYGFYERLWHWTMASGIILLALTGLEIHYAGSFKLLGMAAAVLLHNVLAHILIANAVLSLFYHIVTGEIKQFFGFDRKFVKETVVQAFYYVYGIFRGHAHPIG
ncbi:MAG: hypothetical protein GY765_13295, partial [bacterium]|nr:hypothetical protein [bacterium]